MAIRTVEDEAFNKIANEKLLGAVNGLPIKRRVVVEEHIMSKETQARISKRLGLSKSRVDQIEEIALRDLRIALRKIKTLFN